MALRASLLLCVGTCSFVYCSFLLPRGTVTPSCQSSYPPNPHSTWPFPPTYYVDNFHVAIFSFLFFFINARRLMFVLGLHGHSHGGAGGGHGHSHGGDKKGSHGHAHGDDHGHVHGALDDNADDGLGEPVKKKGRFDHLNENVNVRSGAQSGINWRKLAGRQYGSCGSCG